MKKLSLFGLAVILSTAMFAGQPLNNDKSAKMVATSPGTDIQNDVKGLKDPGGKHPHKRIKHKHKHKHKHGHRQEHRIRNHH